MKNIYLFAAALIAMTSHIAIAKDLSSQEKSIIEKAVKHELSDPESARFKWFNLSQEQQVAMKEKDAAATYCGLVNAKNKMGGYVGDTPFLVVLSWSNGKVSPTNPFVMLAATDEPGGVLAACAKAGYSDIYSAQ
jgi:hypothetical protein